MIPLTFRDFLGPPSPYLQNESWPNGVLCKRPNVKSLRRTSVCCERRRCERLRIHPKKKHHPLGFKQHSFGFDAGIYSIYLHVIHTSNILQLFFLFRQVGKVSSNIFSVLSVAAKMDVVGDYNYIARTKADIVFVCIFFEHLHSSSDQNTLGSCCILGGCTTYLVLWRS